MITTDEAEDQHAPPVVLITGGTSGIGLALAEAFISDGARVAVCGRSGKGVAQFAEAHPGALAVRADITDEEDRRRLLDTVAERLGEPSVLVNNAGTFDERDFSHPESMEGLDQELALNFLAPIHLTADVIGRSPRLTAVVFVTSGFALVSPARAPTYGAAKAGLHGFAEGLRSQLASRGVHVLEVLPPLVDTPMNAHVRGRKMRPEDVARKVTTALARRKPVALPGATRMLPALLRIAPITTRRLIGRT